MDVAVDIDDYSVGRESLRAVTGDGIAVIEVPHLGGIEPHRFAAVHPYGKLAVLVDVFDRAEVAVGNA